MVQYDCDDSSECGVVGSMVVLTAGAFVCLVLGGIVVADYNHVATFQTQICSGQILFSDVHQSGVECARGKAITTFGASSQERPFNRTVELFYPAVNWFIVCKKSSDIEDWLSGLSSSSTFSCLVDHPEANTGVPDGVRTNYDQIGGWIAMMVLSVLFFLVVISAVVYLLWYEKCRRRQ